MTKRYTIKRIIAIIVAFIMIVGFAGMEKMITHAEDATVVIASSTTEYNEGDTIQIVIRISGEKVSSYTINLSYSSDKMEYTGGSSNVSGGGGSLTITGGAPGTSTLNFKAIATGTGVVVASATAYDSTGTALSTNDPSAGFNIKSSEETTTEETTTEETTTEETTEKTEETTSEETTTEKEQQDTTEAQSTESTQQSAQGDVAKIYAADGKIKIESPAQAVTLSDVPENMNVPSGYEKAILEADGVKVNAFMNSTDKNFFIIYANKDGNGDNFSLYSFDKSDGSVQRYISPAPSANDKGDTTTEEEKQERKFIPKKAFVVGCILSAIFLIISIISLIRRRSRDDDYYEDDYDEDDYPRDDRRDRDEDYRRDERRDEDYRRDERRDDDYRRDERRDDDYRRDERRDDDYYRDERREEDYRRDDRHDEEDVPDTEKSEIEEEQEERNAADKLRDMQQDDDSEEEAFEDVSDDESDDEANEEADEITEEVNEETEEASEEVNEEVKKEELPKPKILASEVNPDTGEFIMEEALLNNRHVNVPEVEEDPVDKVKKAMAERPFGIDSAFDVVAENLVKKTDEEIAKDNGIILPKKRRDYDDED